MVALAVAVTVVAPEGAGLAGTWPWVPVLAFRGLVGATALAAAVLLALVTLAAGQLRWTVVRAALAALAAVAVLATLGEAGVLVERGLRHAPPSATAAAGSLTVLEVNTDHSGVDPDVLARLVVGVDADVVTMPETTSALAQEVAQRLARAGRRVQVFSVAGQGTILPTSLLVSDRLGRYQQVDRTGRQAGIVVAEPDPTSPRSPPTSMSMPTLIAAHPQAPVAARDLPAWRRGVGRAVGLCGSSRDAVLAGDFNSTLDHPVLRASTCADAADAAGSAGIGTWPQRLPRLLGAPLDHVFSTRGHWRTSAAWTLPLPGSDHRALVARLAPAGGSA